MRYAKDIRPVAFAAALALLLVVGFARPLQAQTTPATAAPAPSVAPSPVPGAAVVQDPTAKNRPRTTSNKTEPAKPDQNPEPDKNKKVTGAASDIPAETQANRQEVPSEENAIVPYYNNFFNTYHLGPEDVISVTVFGQDRYSRSGITIPPSGRISLALIPGGLFVNGKTVDEVSELIKKRYDEYIIDPEVTVSLDKAASYRYSIVGDVGQPGIRLMNRRMTVTEAIAEAGGVLSTGNKSGVVLLRRQQDNTMAQIRIDVAAIYKGKAPDSTFLIPGDQIFVPGNRMKKLQGILGLVQVLSFARIFTGL